MEGWRKSLSKPMEFRSMYPRAVSARLVYRKPKEGHRADVVADTRLSSPL